MKCEYKEIITEDKKEAISFNVITKKGSASGLFAENKIWVHHIVGDGCVKGIMNILVNKFKINKIIFTPLINDNVKNSIRGEVKICKADNPGNPYGEDFEYLETEWIVNLQRKKERGRFI